MSEKVRVLIVDDDPQHLALVQRLLVGRGMEVETSDAPLGVSNTVRRFEPDVVLLDVQMDRLTGDRILGVARRHAPPGTRFLLHSASDETRLRTLATEAGADGWVSKSTDADELIRVVESHARKRRAEA